MRSVAVTAVAAALAGLIVPVELVELTAASAGLSEAVPVLAPPIGWGARLGFAAMLAVTAVALVWVFGVPAPRRKGKGIMGWPRSFGWRELARFARGERDEAFAGRYAGAERPSATIHHLHDALPRRRADLHPDAPPRPPLMASRDLPAVESPPERRVPAAAEWRAAAPAEGMAPAAEPVRHEREPIQPRPLPRSPQPLSDAQLDALRRLLVDSPAPASGSEHLRDDEGETNASGEISRDAAGAPLESLVDRFERQVERRIAMEQAMSAVAKAEQAMTRGAGVQREAVSPRSADTVDQALDAALATLKKLSGGDRER